MNYYNSVLKNRKNNKLLHIMYGEFKFSVDKIRDQFCSLKNYDVFRINNICKLNNDIILQGKTLINPESVEKYPITSNLLHIIIRNEWSAVKNVNANELLKKAVCLLLKKFYYFFPLIHSCI